MKKFYKTSFNVQLKKSAVEFEKAIASYSNAGSDEAFFYDLRGLIEKQPDLLYGLSILVSEGSNANDDGFLRPILASIFKTPRNKFVDYEHDVDGTNVFKNPTKYKVVGHIYDSSLTTQDNLAVPIPEDLIVQNSDGTWFPPQSSYDGKPLDITVAWVIYKFQYPELAQIVEDRFDAQDNEKFGVSMEVLFTDYKYRVGMYDPAETFDFDAASIGAVEARKGDPLFPKLEELWKKRGRYNGQKVTRILGGEIFFSGMAITKNRANNRSLNLSIASVGQDFIANEEQTVENKDLLSLVKSVASRDSLIDLNTCEIIDGKPSCACIESVASKNLDKIILGIDSIRADVEEVFRQTEAISNNGGSLSCKNAKADMEDYDCPMCNNNQDMDDPHIISHLNDAQNGLIAAQQKLVNLYENNLDNELSRDEILEFVEQIQNLVTRSESALKMGK